MQQPGWLWSELCQEKKSHSQKSTYSMIPFTSVEWHILGMEYWLVARDQEWGWECETGHVWSYEGNVNLYWNWAVNHDGGGAYTNLHVW